MLRVSEDGKNRRREGHIASYKQLRTSLIELQEAADRIFDRISERTAKESEKLVNLSKRIQNAKATIDAIPHSKQTIVIRSSSRYPTNSNEEEDFHSLFGYKDGATGKGFPVAKLLVNGGLNREYGVDGTLELFQFFSETTSDFLPKEVHPKVGSGVIHSNGNAFVENLLEPPHYTYCSLLKRDNIAADSLLSPKHQALPPPPPSLLQSCSALPRLEGFSFRPSVVQSPKLQNTIPDLSKVPHITLSGVDDYQQKEKPETTGASSQVLPQLPPAPLLSHSLAETSFVQKHHTSTDSGATTTLVDNPKLIPPLPIVGFSPLPPEGSDNPSEVVNCED